MSGLTIAQCLAILERLPAGTNRLAYLERIVRLLAEQAQP